LDFPDSSPPVLAISGNFIFVGTASHNKFTTFICSSTSCSPQVVVSGPKKAHLLSLSAASNRVLGTFAVNSTTGPQVLVNLYNCYAVRCPTIIRLGPYNFTSGVGAISNSALAVGLKDDDHGKGSVIVYHCKTPTKCNRIARILSPVPTLGSGFGGSLSLSTDTLAIGAPGLNSAFVYNCALKKCTLNVTAVPTDVSAGDKFGSALSLSGSLLAASSPQAGGGAGKAYIFGELTSSFVCLFVHRRFSDLLMLCSQMSRIP